MRNFNSAVSSTHLCSIQIVFNAHCFDEHTNLEQRIVDLKWTPSIAISTQYHTVRKLQADPIYTSGLNVNPLVTGHSTNSTNYITLYSHCVTFSQSVKQNESGKYSSPVSTMLFFVCSSRWFKLCEAKQQIIFDPYQWENSLEAVICHNDDQAAVLFCGHSTMLMYLFRLIKACLLGTVYSTSSW